MPRIPLPRSPEMKAILQRLLVWLSLLTVYLIGVGATHAQEATIGPASTGFWSWQNIAVIAVALLHIGYSLQSLRECQRRLDKVEDQLGRIPETYLTLREYDHARTH